MGSGARGEMCDSPRYCIVCNSVIASSRKGKTCSRSCSAKLSHESRKTKVYVDCEYCNKTFRVVPSRKYTAKTCSKRCFYKLKSIKMKGNGNHQFGLKGKENPTFKTDRKINERGYVILYKPEHPNSNHKGWVAEHRYVMSELLGRPLEPWEEVHHKDENRTNNEPENLQILTKSEHRRIHAIKEYKQRDIDTVTKRFK